MADADANQPQHETVLDVTGEQIARTYAQGFLGAVGDGGGEAVEQLEALERDVLATNPRLMDALGSAFLDHEQRVAMLDRVFGGRVDAMVLKLMKVLSAHGRIGILGTVAKQARELFNASRNREEVIVRLATPGGDALVERIGKVVGEKLGIEPMISVEIVPELVGGVEIRVGDTVFDGSVRTAFKNAHKTIVAQTVEAIETQPKRFTIAG